MNEEYFTGIPQDRMRVGLSCGDRWSNQKEIQFFCAQWSTTVSDHIFPTESALGCADTRATCYPRYSVQMGWRGPPSWHCEFHGDLVRLVFGGIRSVAICIFR